MRRGWGAGALDGMADSEEMEKDPTAWDGSEDRNG